MKHTTLVTVPATVDGRPFSVTYRVTVVVDLGESLAARGGAPAAWGYAEAVPVQLSAEGQFDLALDHGGDTSHTGDGWA